MAVIEVRDPILGPKTVDFTITEDIGLAVWLEAVLTGHFALARRILQTCLTAEHYRSVLPNFLSDATPEQNDELTRLLTEFDNALKEFRDIRRQQEKESGMISNVLPLLDARYGDGGMGVTGEVMMGDSALLGGDTRDNVG